MMVAVGTSSCSSSSRFGPTSTFKRGHAREVAARPVQAGDKSELRPGRSPIVKTIGMVVVAAFAASAAGGAGRGNHGHLTANQIGRQRRQSIVLVLRPAIFDRHVPALDIAGFAQALAERAHTVRVPVRRCAAEEPDHRHRRLLRARRERPRRRRAAEQRDELAPPHSITSSARASSIGGTSRPSALAVLRLITSSNLVGCSTGRSAGFAPRRILST